MAEVSAAAGGGRGIGGGAAYGQSRQFQAFRAALTRHGEPGAVDQATWQPPWPPSSNAAYWTSS